MSASPILVTKRKIRVRTQLVESPRMCMPRSTHLPSSLELILMHELAGTWLYANAFGNIRIMTKIW